VAIAPFWIQRSRTVGLFPVRLLRFLGSSGVASDYLDIIVQKKDHARWIKEIWDRLFSDLRRYWDVLAYENARSDSTALGHFYRLADEDDRCVSRQIVNAETCPYMPLPDQATDLVSGLSRTRRYTINHSRKRLGEKGVIRIDTCRDSQQVTDALTRLRELNTRSWRERGQSGSFSTREFIRFHSDFAQLSLQLDRLLLCSLWAGDSYLGGFYGFVYHGVLYFYIMSVEHSDEKRVNAGDVLLSHCMEEGIRRGCEVFDFLRGDEAYKYRWTDSQHRLLSLQIYNRRLTAALSLVSQYAWQSVKAIGKTLLRR
jgi:CelD/BcsL family acetyltransferase involved in cellulose biosynthesis